MISDKTRKELRVVLDEYYGKENYGERKDEILDFLEHQGDLVYRALEEDMSERRWEPARTYLICYKYFSNRSVRGNFIFHTSCRGRDLYESVVNYACRKLNVKPAGICILSISPL